MNLASNPVETLMSEFRGAGLRFRPEEPLARYTTIGLGGPAELMVFPSSAKELASTVHLAQEMKLSFRVLGGGSNLLVSDDGVRGMVIYTGAMKNIRFDEASNLEAEAGVNFPALVRAASSRGLRGLEGGVGIPGSLGGVLAMNAGAYEFSIGDWVEQVTVVTAEKGKQELTRDQVDFRYRTSSFDKDFIVAGCRLQLAEDDPKAIRAEMDQHLSFRKQTQPVGVKSAGCIFKNPSGDSAGKIIDGADLKGLRVGGARVSEVHANFIVHDGDATAADVFALIDEIRERVWQATSVELEEEVKRWM